MAAKPKKPMAPAMLTLIDELARRAVREYLTERAAQDSHSSHPRSNRDALPDLTKAA